MDAAMLVTWAFAWWAMGVVSGRFLLPWAVDLVLDSRRGRDG